MRFKLNHRDLQSNFTEEHREKKELSETLWLIKQKNERT